jgi:hypothetical protein
MPAGTPDAIPLLQVPDWQQTICRELRDLIHAADPEIAETIKRTVQPYFVLDGNVCALLATKDHVNLFLYDRGIVPDPEGIITAGHENKSARMISLSRGDTINARALTAMLQLIMPTTAPADGESSRRAIPAAEPSDFRQPAELALNRAEPLGERLDHVLRVRDRQAHALELDA